MQNVIKKVLRQNPHISKLKIKESLLMARQLAETGVKMSEYNLSSPFSRRRAKEEESITYDKRMRGQSRV